MKSRLLFILLAPLFLTGCLLSPGKFASELTMMKSGDFSYTYKGEIQMLALGKLAEMGANAEEAFEEQPCYHDNGYEERTCTANEIAGQKAEWEATAANRKAKKEREAKQVQAMMGGIDPSSPEAAAEMAERLQRQKGWKSVVHKGDGLFEVDFAINGALTHDFAFPMIEKMPVGSSFVTVILREDGKVRVDATGFAGQGAGNPWQGMMSGAMGMAMMESQNSEGQSPNFVTPEGSFSIRTDGTILANNTDEGPGETGTVSVLHWDISPRTEQAPTALIDLSS